MEDKVINNRISEIFNLFSQLIVMQIQALYDDYEEKELYEIEKDYHEKYKNLINKSTKDLDIYCKIKEFIFSEVDYYGLDTRENDIKSDIENLFYDFSKNLSVESMIMRDEWKKKHVGELEENISFLNGTIKNLREKHQILEKDFEIIKRKSKDLSKEIDTYLQKNKKLSFENRNLNVEIQDLKNQNNNLEFEKNNLKSEVLSLKNNRKKEKDIEKTQETKKLKAEIEHLKNGINLLQSQIKEKESSKLKVCDEKNKLLNDYNKVLSKNNDMEKEIQKLKTEIIKLSKDSNKTKISLKEAKNQFDEMYKEIFEELKRIVSRKNIIQGHNLMDYANTINKKRASFKYLESSDDMSELLLDFIIQLSKLHNLLERNSKESNLGQYIKELKELKDKI